MPSAERGWATTRTSTLSTAGACHTRFRTSAYSAARLPELCGSESDRNDPGDGMADSRVLRQELEVHHGIATPHVGGTPGAPPTVVASINGSRQGHARP